jgi:hypothetical protein
VRAIGRAVAPVLGAAILTAFSIAALPVSRGLFQVPRTPYDASEASFIVPAWVLLSRAEPLLPPGALVLVRSERPDAMTDTYLHRFAVALLPGRRIVPAARWGVPSEAEDMRTAQYEVVVGRSPAASADRRPLLEIPEGTVWRRLP